MALRLLAALASVIAFTMPAAATVVTFDSQANTGFIQQYGPSYQEADLTFTISSGSAFGLFSWGAGGFNADPDGATIAPVASNTGISITATAGGAFMLNSIDLASMFNDTSGSSVDYVLVTGSGTSSGTFTLAHSPGLQLFELDWNDVISLTLTSSGGYQLDNVDYSRGASVPTPTPEPASWAMMAAGFGLLGTLMRRRPARRLAPA